MLDEHDLVFGKVLPIDRLQITKIADLAPRLQ